MAYDRHLADRVRELVADEDGLAERPMFGGLAFLVHGNMAVAAASRGGLLVRVDPAQSAALTDDTHVRPMVMHGRPMRGWLQVDREAVRTAPRLEQWVARGVSFARTLPAKHARS
ncbi:TfoX/Sxy family transcriptional regulator of competence genes [Prauserella shujinwangii]|uniref:TfoX/Sxy family transcriptional regulator of competence genes n=1 Tax=Prauserella shujinwangii TaxID=1453103 RepID=A0A2T0M2F7_9PSEU|nr:TfoX/Sxy family protein [Prauserella shujinwangii]PRX50928.1 TfoX/Sxy family transcriptional regulator of competence genes [Prauserella shujinwangii]